MKRAPKVGCLLLVCLFWNGIVGVFDVTIARSLLRASEARSSFVEVPVEVTRTDIDVDSSGDGTSYRPIVEYRYTFDGVERTGDQVNYNTFGTSDRGSAERIVGKYEVGEAATALVDPDDPDESVLDASLEHFPGALFVFLTPFHCIGLGILIAIVMALREKGGERDPVRSRYVTVDTERHLVIAKPMYSALTVFLFALTIVSFVATFALILTQGFTAPIATSLAVLGVCVAIAGGFGLKRMKTRRSPESFIHVDKRLGLYSYPADAQGERLEDVRAIVLQSAATGTTINNVAQYRHRFTAETVNGDVPLFDMKTGQDDGERLRELLESELVPG